jgi:GntR family transcriptional regulator
LTFSPTIVRLRSVDGEPLSIHRSFVPANLAPDLDIHDVVNQQLCVILDQNYGLTMETVNEDLEAVALEGEDARMLGLSPGKPALLLTDLISRADGAPFEYSRIVFRGDSMRLRFDYRL